MPWSTQTQSAKMAVIYITVGALIDVWTGVYYFLILRPQAAQNPENGSQTSFFWVLGFFLTGLSLLVIGLLVGRIGQAARKAEVASPPVTVVAPAHVEPVPVQSSATPQIVGSAAVHQTALPVT